MVTCLLVATLAATGRAGAQQSGGAFGDANAYAQQRTVKIYGAAIGRVTGYGTGLLVSDDGLIVTAEGVHLAARQLRVTLPDGSIHEASLERRFHDLQLALLKIKAATPNFFDLREHPTVRSGDWVLAVSNAFKVADGAEPLSVTLGIVSLRTRLEAARRGTQDAPYNGEVLLIDCITSNPGAAGGAVVATDGRLVGMIGKVLESTSTNTRLNYAVPADLIELFVAGKLEEAAPVETPAVKAVLGIRLFALGGRKGPAYIDRILTSSPAADVKLQIDDLIVSLAGRPVRSIQEYDEILDTLRPGEEVTLIVKRKNELVEVRITPQAENEK